MDCIPHLDSPFAALENRPVSAAFDLAVIENAVRFLQQHLQETGAGPEPQDACEEALEAVSALRRRQR
ncbi:hypothetical protein [Hyphomonas sp.]|uniref:hypothetical protein n=1 Tax=Hyphomonas sp. TaxID=87 RepID=UPI00391D934E